MSNKACFSYNVLIYYIGYEMIKDSKYVKINSINPLYLIFIKVNGHFEEINGIHPTNQNKTEIKKNEELWIKIRDLIRSETRNSDDYNENM